MNWPAACSEHRACGGAALDELAMSRVAAGCCSTLQGSGGGLAQMDVQRWCGSKMTGICVQGKECGNLKFAKPLGRKVMFERPIARVDISKRKESDYGIFRTDVPLLQMARPMGSPTRFRVVWLAAVKPGWPRFAPRSSSCRDAATTRVNWIDRDGIK